MKVISDLIKLNRHISIQFKIMGMIITLIIALALWINWEVRDKVSSLLEKQMIERAIVTSNNVSYIIAEPVLTNNFYQLNNIIDEFIKADKSIRYYFILDKDGTLLLSSFTVGIPENLVEINSPVNNKANVKEITTEEGIIWDVATPIANGYGGTLRIGITDKSITLGLYEVTRKIIFSTTVTIILTIFVAFALTRLLTLPLKQLVQFANNIGQGNYNTTLKAESWASKEIAFLLETFNRMAKNLKNISIKIDHAQKVRKTLLQKIITAQEEERARVARELHDEANQYMAAINIGLDRIAAENDPEKSKNLSKELKKIVLHASSELKHLAWELRPTTIDKIGLTSALENYIDNCKTNNKINIDFACDIKCEEQLDDEVKIAVFRIIQEALTNILKHSDADEVEVTLKNSKEYIIVIIEDNGKGFDTDTILQPAEKPSGKIKSLGIHGMMERAELIDGKLIIESEPNQGTTVYLKVPLRKDVVNE
ncbi:MAG: ATP-binding protein [Tepidibacillus sp.]